MVYDEWVGKIKSQLMMFHFTKRNHTHFFSVTRSQSECCERCGVSRKWLDRSGDSDISIEKCEELERKVEEMRETAKRIEAENRAKMVYRDVNLVSSKYWY